MTDHTPGPWRVDRLSVNDEVVIRADDEVAYLCMAFGRDKDKNARLIAAAPELLRSLQRIVEENADCVTNFDMGSALYKARKAIALATGE